MKAVVDFFQYLAEQGKHLTLPARLIYFVSLAILIVIVLVAVVLSTVRVAGASTIIEVNITMVFAIAIIAIALMVIVYIISEKVERVEGNGASEEFGNKVDKRPRV